MHIYTLLLTRSSQQGLGSQKSDILMTQPDKDQFYTDCSFVCSHHILQHIRYCLFKIYPTELSCILHSEGQVYMYLSPVVSPGEYRATVPHLLLCFLQQIVLYKVPDAEFSFSWTGCQPRPERPICFAINSQLEEEEMDSYVLPMVFMQK